MNQADLPSAHSRERQRVLKEGRSFAFTLAGGFVLVALIGTRKQQPVVVSVAVALALAALLAGVMVPGKLGPLRRQWLKVGDLIGAVTTPVMLGALYFLVLAPAGVFRRFRRQPRPTPGWRRRDPLPPASRMERQF